MEFQRYIKRPYVKLFFCAAILIALVYIHIISQEYICDAQSEKELLKTPAGKTIPKYNPDIKIKTFGELSKTCAFVNNKIVCPDVRHHGETVFRQSQLAMNRMLKIFDLICIKHNISYWIDAGTLLGAIRNQNIIPWDHDTDVAMLEEDYEKFLKIAKKELPEDIMFADVESDPGYRKHINAEAKLRDLNSCYGRNIKLSRNYQDGLQVDIFTFRKEVINDEDYIKMVRGSFKCPYSYVFPLRTITYDGFKMSSPNTITDYIKTWFGEKYMVLPKPFQQCPMNGIGYIPIPWYTCDYVKGLDKEKQDELLKSFLIVKKNTKSTDVFYRIFHKYIYSTSGRF